MDKIKRIENFLDGTNKGIFGIPLKSCFVVEESFTVDIILKYESVSNQGPYKRVSEEWQMLNTIKGDYIFTSDNESFLIIDEDNNYVRCRPHSDEGSSESPDLRRFDTDKLKKVGPTEKLGYPVPFKSREEIFIGRAL